MRLIDSAIRLRAVVVALGVFAGLLAFDVSVAEGHTYQVVYDDVPDDAYYAEAVESLGHDGVFAGTECAGGFCPGAEIDRKTMAVWMVRLRDGADPAAVSGSRFDDVDPAGFHGPFIERMADLEITHGCEDGSAFCPDRPVRRAEMAVFLSRAFSLADSPDPGFADVPSGAWYAADVARLAASRVTAGCGDGTRFCPDRNTTRAEMATFLARATGRVAIPEQDDDVPPTDDSPRLDHDVPPPTGAADYSRSGTEAVAVYLCGPAGTYNDSMLSQLVTSLNQQVAPFYGWQSSGLFELTFEAGTVITTTQPAVRYDSNDGHCMGTARAARPTRYSAVIKHQTFDDLPVGGYAAGSETMNYDDCSRREGSWPCGRLLFVVGHETDHSVLNIPHDFYLDEQVLDLHGIEYVESIDGNLFFWGLTRGWFGFSSANPYATLFAPPSGRGFGPGGQFGFEDGVLVLLGSIQVSTSEILSYAFEGDYSTIPEDQISALSCKSRAALKWPTGPDRPVCAKSRLLTPDVFELTRDGPYSTRVAPTGFSVQLSPRLGYIQDLSAMEGYHVRLTQRAYLVSDNLDSQADAEALVRAAVAPTNIRDRCAWPASPTPVQYTDPCVQYVTFWTLPDGTGRVEYSVDSWHRYSGNGAFVVAGIIPDSVASAEIWAFSSDQLGAPAHLELGAFFSAAGEVQFKDRSNFSGDRAPRIEDLNYVMTWQEHPLAVEYRIRGFGLPYITESGSFHINGWSQGLEFGTTHNIAIDACITIAGVSHVITSQGTTEYPYSVSCYEYAKATLTTPAEADLQSLPGCEARHLVPGSNAPSTSPSNVVVLDVWDTEANLRWDPVPCATWYVMLPTSPEGAWSTDVSAVRFRERPIGSMGHLEANTEHTVEIWACNWELDEEDQPRQRNLDSDRCSKSAPIQFTTTG